MYEYINQRVPEQDGYLMPAEFSEHASTIIVWPERPGSWSCGAAAARKAFTELIENISEVEAVYVIVGDSSQASARAMLPVKENIKIINIPTDDSWARDISPTFLLKNGGLAGVNWRFNAWGGEYDGLYTDYKKDDGFAGLFCRTLDCRLYDAAPFVLEGGSIHTDGEGTLLTSECCLLSKGRNPGLSKAEIEDKLKKYTGVSKVIWISDGIYNDETNGHIDNMAAFIAPGELVLAWSDNPDDPQFELSHRAYEQLLNARDAKGRAFKIHKLPVPDKPMCITRAQLEGYTFEDGEDTREVGERLAASYVNFYFANGIVLLPQFCGENAGSDRRALDIMRKICADRRIIPVSSGAILLGGGNIHCVTSQIPAYKFK